MALHSRSPAGMTLSNRCQMSGSKKPNLSAHPPYAGRNRRQAASMNCGARALGGLLVCPAR